MTKTRGMTSSGENWPDSTHISTHIYYTFRCDTLQLNFKVYLYLDMWLIQFLFSLTLYLCHFLCMLTLY